MFSIHFTYPEGQVMDFGRLFISKGKEMVSGAKNDGKTLRDAHGIGNKLLELFAFREDPDNPAAIKDYLVRTLEVVKD